MIKFQVLYVEYELKKQKTSHRVIDRPTSVECGSTRKRTSKGEVRHFFSLAQSFYRPQTKTSLKRQFSPKSPEVGKKSGQRIQNSQNKNQIANSSHQLL